MFFCSLLESIFRKLLSKATFERKLSCVSLPLPHDIRRILLRIFVAQLAAATKICPQPCQNAAATKCGTNIASSDADEDVLMLF